MRYKVMIARRAAKALKKLPLRPRERITERIAMLGHNPDNPALDVKPLDHHPDAGFRLRVGAYRVLFDRDDAIRIIAITRVAHRKEAYR
ncbi:MAG: type II toxin-antitoxin system RelE/ParE family toxin [Mariprofundaceae bacterium]